MSENQVIIIFGRNPVLDKLKQSASQIAKIYIKEGLFDGTVRAVQSLCKEHRIPISNVPERKLNELAGKVNHQGIVALMSAVSYLDYEEWRSNLKMETKPFVLLLSEIEDTGNFGAIIRSATAAGVQAILIPKHRQVPITGSVMKASAGTAGLVPIIRVANVNQTLSELKDLGFWTAGLSADANDTIWNADFKRPLVLVIGSEGKGLRVATLKLCDFKLSIPMTNQVESLNASVAAALVLFEVVRQRKAE